MSLGRIVQLYQFVWMLESHAQQRLSWDDAAQARTARLRADAQAAMQARAMLDANPSGSLGHAMLNDDDALSPTARRRPRPALATSSAKRPANTALDRFALASASVERVVGRAPR
ncbi:hypothetical protein C8J38_10836 [Rhizobium sp. PP-WC-2G-219]|nr:hypothetical protein C8J38_10836 [Rhizobium sp. PP-WC-2G-219]